MTVGELAGRSARLPSPMQGKALAGQGTLLAALILLGVAFVTRVWVFGNPVIHIDEQFYLLTGDRMLHGLLPYADIYDRKPIGLFLIYAGIRLLGGDGVVQYQLVAMLSATATALLICRIAGRVAPPAGALAAGIAYLLYTLAFNGVGGQSPIFYNSIMAGAALLTMRSVTRPAPRHLTAMGAAIMLLIGLAIQIKYSVVFEGMFFGLALLWRSWSDGQKPWKLGLQGLLWVTCALAPTGLALATYYAAGHADAFLFANFKSIFGRHEPREMVLGRLFQTAALLAPVWVLLFHAPGRPIQAEQGKHADWQFLRLWALAAIGGFLLFGSYYDHYALPLLVPLTALASLWLGNARGVTLYGIALLGFGLVSGVAMTIHFLHLEGNRAEFDRMSSLVKAHLNGGCLEAYEGPPALYRSTGACFVTRYVFPGFLNNAKEVTSLAGTNSIEMATLLARHPRVIVMNEEIRPQLTNMTTRRMLEETVHHDYHLIARLPLGERHYLIYERGGA